MSLKSERQARARHHQQMQARKNKVSGPEMARINKVIDYLVTADPEDNAIQRNHGFSPADPHADSDLCKNGCGASYHEIIGGKMLQCSAPDKGPTELIRDEEKAAWVWYGN